jgi:hypothetical protein
MASVDGRGLEVESCKSGFKRDKPIRDGNNCIIVSLILKTWTSY